MILEGRKMGYRFVVLDPSPDCPAAQVADEQIVGEYQDFAAASQLAQKSDVVLYEFENVDPTLVKKLEEEVSVPQGSHLLTITRHRLEEKKALARAAIPVTPYLAVEKKSDIVAGLAELGSPVILKTTTGGYDGKGQWRLASNAEIEALPDDMFSPSTSYILEQFVPFEKELSVVVARSLSGEVKVFPPTVNIHRNHILHMSIAPSPIDKSIRQQAIQLGKQVAERLNVVGLIAVEMFLLPDGKLFVNETAPRPHNSGHYTYDACQTSQFEQIIRATIGLPLHEIHAHQSAVMVNLLGEHQAAFFDQLAKLPTNAKVHWYGKREAKTGRKMGHITFVGENVTELIEQIEQIPIWAKLTAIERAAITKKEGSMND